MKEVCKVQGCWYDATNYLETKFAMCLKHFSDCNLMVEDPAKFIANSYKPPAAPATAPKKNEGKPKLRYLSPEFLLSIARAMTWGEGKYPKDNYLKLPSEDLYDSMLRHMLEVVKDKDSVDSESGLKHLDHFRANVLMWTENLVKKG